MAGGWARDGAVQDQIDASVDDAVKRARSDLEKNRHRPAAEFCEECEAPIPEARRRAVPGVRYCVSCQEALDQDRALGAINRRGSKDSQLR